MLLLSSLRISCRYNHTIINLKCPCINLGDSQSAFIFLCIISIGLLFGLCILQTPGVTKEKKVLRCVFGFIFVIIVGSALYQNIWESLQQGSVYAEECSTLEYERLCQAKCYCGQDIIGINKTFYQHCKNYTICRTPTALASNHANYCKILQKELLP